jgi:(R)-2-hydroxyacyl-CoA dehydratese activating ATPase
MRLGIDLGSRNIKLVYGKDESYKKICFETIGFYKKYGRHLNNKFEIDLEKLYFDVIGEKGFFDKIISTGYGRNSVSLQGSEADEVIFINNITEIKAHALGAVKQFNKKDLLVIDIGGQDTKIIQIKNEKIIDFEINDNCAASSGRYLENMCKVLDVDLDYLSGCYENPEHLSSTCVVFGESELIGKIAQGVETKKLCAGINQSVVKRIIGMLNRFKINNVCIVGGAALNKAIKVLLEQELKTEVLIPKDPLYNGAIGVYFACISN